MSESGKLRFVLAMSLFARARGLLGTHTEWGNGICVLAILPCRSVHTFGMRYPLDIAFCDRHGAVIRSERNVLPGRLLSCRKAAFVLEKPHSSKAPWPKIGDSVPFSLYNQPKGHCGA